MKVYENNDGMGPYEQCVQLVYKQDKLRAYEYGFEQMIYGVLWQHVRVEVSCEQLVAWCNQRWMVYGLSKKKAYVRVLDAAYTQACEAMAYEVYMGICGLNVQAAHREIYRDYKELLGEVCMEAYDEVLYGVQGKNALLIQKPTKNVFLALCSECERLDVVNDEASHKLNV